MVDRETRLAGYQATDRSMFQKNLERINSSLQYTNNYYTPKYERPIDYEKRNNIENDSPKITNKDDKKRNIKNYFTELYNISLAEIESTRKRALRKTLNQKVSALKQKRSCFTLKNPIREPICLAFDKYKTDVVPPLLMSNNKYKKKTDIENCAPDVHVDKGVKNKLEFNDLNIIHKLTKVREDNCSVNTNETNKLSTSKFNIDKHNACTDVSNLSFKIEHNNHGIKNKHNEFMYNYTYKFEDEYRQFLENHFAIQEYLKNYESLYISFLQDVNLKCLRHELMKAINTPVNSLSSASPWHMKDKFDKLNALFMCEIVKSGNSYVSVKCHPCALIFCKDTLAKNIVKIGEQVVSVTTGTAFEVASVAVELWQLYPDFGMLLYARFKQRCPCLIPYNSAKTTDESDEEHYKSLGYIYADGVVENQDKYVIRMTGIIRLFAAIIVTETKSGKALGIGQAWMIIATTVNIVPQLDITAILLHEMLIITGYHLRKAYSKQFIKMVHYINTDYMIKIDQVTPMGCGGPVQRLKTFISKVIELGYIDKPKGILPYDFW